MKAYRIRVKICGMTSEEDILYAALLGVDAVGLIFYSNSSRFVSLEKAKSILQNLPLFVNAVAVLVNPTASEVKEILSRLPIQYLQFHGDESPQFCSQFNVPYIKAVQAIDSQAIIEAVNVHSKASAILIDTPHHYKKGGTGEIFDWGIIPSSLNKPIILAGGLNISNIEAAITTVSPFAIDLCTGVEASAGIKNKGKMTQFMNLLRDINNVR